MHFMLFKSMRSLIRRIPEVDSRPELTETGRLGENTRVLALSSFVEIPKFVSTLYKICTVQGYFSKINVYFKGVSFQMQIKKCTSCHNYTVSQELQCARFSRVFTCPPIV